MQRRRRRSSQGVGDVRLLLDDGTYTSSDPNGQFHFEKVCDGTHVVQLDLESLPPDTEAIPCIQNTRFAGRSFSQFVDVQGGTLWRTDFYLRRKPQAAIWRARGAATRPRRCRRPRPRTRSRPAAARSPTTRPPRAARPTGSRRRCARPARAGCSRPRATTRARPRCASRSATTPRSASRSRSRARPVDPLMFDGTKTSADGRVAVSVWRGIPLAEGDNELIAEIVDAAGNTVQTLVARRALREHARARRARARAVRARRRRDREARDRGALRRSRRKARARGRHGAVHDRRRPTCRSR